MLALRQELREEQGLPLTPSAEAPPLRLTRDIMERVLMARLTDPPPGYPQPPLEYLLGCYGRASAASRGLPALSDKQALAHLQATLANSRALVVSYAGLMLTMDMFPQVGSLRCRPTPLPAGTRSTDPAFKLPAAITTCRREVESATSAEEAGEPRVLSLRGHGMAVPCVSTWRVHVTWLGQ